MPEEFLSFRSGWLWLRKVFLTKKEQRRDTESGGMVIKYRSLSLRHAETLVFTSVELVKVFQTGSLQLQGFGNPQLLKS